MQANFLVCALKLGQVPGPALGKLDKLGRAKISNGGLIGLVEIAPLRC